MKTNFKTFFKRSCLSAAMIAAGFGLSADKAQANAEVTYFYNTYNNPARMDLLTQSLEVMVGGTGTDLEFKYRGTQYTREGKSRSDRLNFHPYGNIMYRIPQAPKWVVGFDVSGPAFDNMNYKHGVARGTKAQIRSNFYNWKVSYQAFDNFTIGFGIVLGHLRKANYNFQLPNAQGVPALQYKTKTRGSKATWNAGFLWKAAQGTFFSGSVWARMHGFSHGHADVYSLANGQLLASRGIKVDAQEPDNFELTLLQFLSKEWLVQFTGRYMLWRGERRYFTFYHAPLPTQNGIITTNLPFPLHYKNSWVLEGVTRYQLDANWAVLGAFNYNSNCQPLEFRPIIFPANWTWFTGAGMQYMPTENWMATLIFGYAFSDAKIRHHPENARGRAKVRVPSVDFNMTYKF